MAEQRQNTLHTSDVNRMSAAFRGMGLRSVPSPPPSAPYVVGSHGSVLRRGHRGGLRGSGTVDNVRDHTGGCGTSSSIPRSVVKRRACSDEEKGQRPGEEEEASESSVNDDDGAYGTRFERAFGELCSAPKSRRRTTPPPSSPDSLSTPDERSAIVVDEPRRTFAVPMPRATTLLDSHSARSSTASIGCAASQSGGGGGGGGGSSPRRTAIVTAEDAFRITTAFYPFGSSPAGRCTELRLDPDTQVFGCDELRRRLKRCFASASASAETRAPFTVQEPHILWHTSPFGSGARTMVESLCAKYRMNLIVASTQSGRNVSDLCVYVPFTKGQYAAMVDDAIRASPCVLFIDRIDPHFEVNYEETGHELIGSWDAYEQRCLQAEAQVAQVWIVISTAHSLASTMQRSAITPLPRMHQHESTSEALGVRDCVEILCNTYMLRAHRARIVSYDCPSDADQSDDDSEYVQLRRSVEPLMARIAQAMHRAAIDAGFSVRPLWLATVVKTAYEYAAIRVSCDDVLSAPPSADPSNGLLRRYLPSTEEVARAVRCLPLDAFRALDLCLG